MPLKIKGFTTKDENDDYNVYINVRLSEETQLLALEHEVRHIVKGDFYCGKSVKEIEDDNAEKASVREMENKSNIL